MRTFVVQWSGPYEDFELSEKNRSNNLYIITGCLKYQRTIGIQYCGITTRDLYKRLNERNHKRNLIKRQRQYWIGNIISDEDITKKDLEMVESLIIYFWQPELNEKKRKNPPSKTVVINRWYDKEQNLRKQIRHHAQKLDDVIFWDGKYWHLSKNLKIYEN